MPFRAGSDSEAPIEQPNEESAEWLALSRYLAGESDADEIRSVEARLSSRGDDAAFARFLQESDIAAPLPNVEQADQAANHVVDVESALAAVRVRIAAETAGDAAVAANDVVVAQHAVSAPRLTVSDGGTVHAPAVRATRLGASTGQAAAGRTARERSTTAARSRRAFLAAAAAFVLLVGYGQRDRLGLGSGAVTSGSNGAGRAPDRVLASGEAVYATPIGVRDSVVLADGSRVMLAPGSTLTLSGTFPRERIVTLVGAAYFQVQHDAAHPFSVQTQGAVVRDIGTAFSVSTDAVGAVTVAVTDGVVALQRAGTSGAGVELSAGDRGVATSFDLHDPTASDGMDATDSLGNQASGTAGGRIADSMRSGARPVEGARPQGAAGIVVTRGAVTSADIAWTSGELSYREASVALIEADLRRWFGVEIVITDPQLRRQTLQISFKGDSAASAVRKVALALGADVIMRGDTVTLQRPAR